MARPFSDFVWVGGEEAGRRAVVTAGSEEG
jgi:hypothetical protein